MKYSRMLALMLFCTLSLILSCTPAEETDTDNESESDVAEDSGESVQKFLPRNLDAYMLGDTFVPGELFTVDDNAAEFRFNDVPGVTWVSEVDEYNTIYTVCTINDIIFKVKKTMLEMPFSEADSMLAVHLTMYGGALDRENRPQSETDMHWINFGEEGTALRIEYLNGRLNIDLSAFDLKP